MYILKNALKCIGRSKGRNCLIGIIVFVIAVSACVGLSIRQAAETAKNDTMENLSVTATISVDRSSMMNSMKDGGFDRNKFSSQMENASSLSLDDYLKYAAAESVKDFYYSVTASLNGTDDFEPVTTDTEEESENEREEKEKTKSDPFGNFGNMSGTGGRPGRIGTSGDFTVIGYSGENAMSAFYEGTASIKSGKVFTEGTSDFECIVSDELAAFNNLSVGDTVTLVNPNIEGEEAADGTVTYSETYTLTVVGFYTDSSANTDDSFQRFGMTASDPANKIYMSYNALKAILDASEKNAVTETNDDGFETSSAIRGTLSGTYTFADTDAYYRFEEEVRTLGLDDTYTVSSADINSFENSLTPLRTLSETAGTFLIVILVIGAVILVVLNIFNVRERKYEIGVLTAMGMKKGKVVIQLLTEIFVVTMVAVIIGAGIGAVSSVPVTNKLLENQVTSQNEQFDKIDSNFGRNQDKKPDMGNKPNGNENFGERFMEIMGGNNRTNYITEINSAMNITVVFQMLGIAVLLTLIAGSVSMMFVMRYEPLKILANRD